MKIRINFKAVIVILFGIFCLYVYFRLINPYLDVGGNSKIVSEDIFTRKVVYINSERYSYWTNGVTDPSKIYVMLPPSTATGDYFGKYAIALPKNVLVIAPDYPGRGLTDSLKTFDTAPLIAYRVGVLLKNLIPNETFSIFAPSFGGMIGTYLALDSELNVEKLYLVATGEFFADDQKFMFKSIFYPAIVSERIRKKYVDFLTRNNFFSNLYNTKVEDILEQWIVVLDYKIDTSKHSSTPTVIVNFEMDRVVVKESVQKLQKIFVNNKVVLLNMPHTSPSFFNLDLLEILNNN